MKFTASASLTAVLATSLALPSLAAPVSSPASAHARSVSDSKGSNFTPNSHASVGDKDYGLGKRSPAGNESARSVSDTSRFRERIARGLAARDRAVSALASRQAPTHECNDETEATPAAQSFATAGASSPYPVTADDGSSYPAPPPDNGSYEAAGYSSQLPTTNAPPARYPAPPPPAAVPYPYGASGVAAAPASGGLVGSLLGGITSGGGPLGGLTAPLGGLTGGLTGPGSPVGGLTSGLSGALNGLPGGTALSGLLGSLLGTQSAGAAGVQNVGSFSASPSPDVSSASLLGGGQLQQAAQSAMSPELQAALGTILSAVGDQLTQSLAATSPAVANTVPVTVSEMEAPMGTPPLSTLMSGNPLSSSGKDLQDSSNSLLSSLSAPSDSSFTSQGVNIDVGKTIHKIVPGLGNSVPSSSSPPSANAPPSVAAPPTSTPPSTPPTPSAPDVQPPTSDEGIPDFASSSVGSAASPYTNSSTEEDQDSSDSDPSASSSTGVSLAPENDDLQDDDGSWEAASAPDAEAEGAHMKPSDSVSSMPPLPSSTIALSSSAIPSATLVPSSASAAIPTSSAIPSSVPSSIPTASPTDSIVSVVPSPSATIPSVLIKVSDPEESDELVRRDLSRRMVKIMRKRYVESPKDEPTSSSSEPMARR